MCSAILHHRSHIQLYFNHLFKYVHSEGLHTCVQEVKITDWISKDAVSPDSLNSISTVDLEKGLFRFWVLRCDHRCHRYRKKVV